ncbi:UvrD-helicase domain-containing protein [Microbacterium sp. ProA8]|uniref:UvrD-helicase domain-containing protein n=1 Tax=Microbacterium chionoecetis TaxID=3153754 RepID=UPI003265A9E4
MTLIEVRDDTGDRTAIANDTDRTLFVEAGAGTGKTHALVGRVKTLVLRDGVPLTHLAVITFTEKAGAELRDRLRAALEEVGADDPQYSAAGKAVEDLDHAPIGTIHSFAQRLLAAYPIQAGMPLLVEALDEVASSVAFDERWSVAQRRLLDDESLAAPLGLLLGAGRKLDDLRSLARAFGNDWDLIADRVLAEPVPTVMPALDVDPILRQAQLLLDRRSECRDSGDRLVTKLADVESSLTQLRRATSDVERFRLLGSLGMLKFGNFGRRDNWPDIAGMRGACADLASEASALVARVVDAAVRPVARWIAAWVLESAEARISSGELEFHDLLVAARDLLRRDPAVREELQEQYRYLLIDEFQDTDPIQLELAVRIAGGLEAEAIDWRDISVPPGSLFLVGDPKQSIYRFRRASIETYLEAQEKLGTTVSLSRNFRTTPPVIDWVNGLFGGVIVEQDRKQPPFAALAPYRQAEAVGADVTLLGVEEHPDARLTADELRAFEAADVAGVVTQALVEGWTVSDKRTGEWRAIRASDIAILIPARTSLPFLEAALSAAGISYRTESSSLVYSAPEVRAMMAALRSIADTGDELATVAALRSPLFACGDDDLYRYRRAGGRFRVGTKIPDAAAELPAALAMDWLGELARRSRWMSPAELLTELALERRVLETAVVTDAAPLARDQWSRVRFVIDQARAWAEVEHGGLREYLAWATRQTEEGARVAEAILPEHDLDVVRIMTVHAAKGLEFGMVVLSGMTARPRNVPGVQLLWPDAGGYAVRLGSGVQTNDFETAKPLDEQMDDLERRRLLYVAATRARDHLAVSLHRAANAVQTSARVLAGGGALDAPGAVAFVPTDDRLATPLASNTVPWAGTDASWRESVEAARARSAAVAARSASGLEGTEPEAYGEIAVYVAAEDEALAEVTAGKAKGARDLELPPWLKGRYGTMIGRAVHGVLQTVALDGSASDDEFAAVVAAQCAAEGVTEFADAVAGYARSALASRTVGKASRLEHWRELFVASVEGDGTVLEGFMDLMYRDADGGLSIVDYKTDAIPVGAVRARSAYYAPQLHAYERALTAATGAPVRSVLLFVRADGSAAWEVELAPAGA